MNRRSHLGLLIFALTANILAGQPQALTVAVYNFTADKEAAGYGSKVTALVTADLTTETNLMMLERSELNKALKEQAFGISGMVSSDAAAKIGAMTGAKVLVAGQVIRTKQNHLVIIANIIGTETGRLFAAKVEGATDNLVDLAADLSRKIAQKIQEQAGNFVTENKSHDEYVTRILDAVTGTNRPSVSVNLHWPKRVTETCVSATTEMGIILQKAGFSVVDNNSERKPDVEITGTVENDAGPRRGGLYSSHSVINIEVRQRQTGRIIAFDHQTADGVGLGQAGARKEACANAADGLAERILPLLAK
jgi:TolB-like protein